jgi:hypothetical protein
VDQDTLLGCVCMCMYVNDGRYGKYARDEDVDQGMLCVMCVCVCVCVCMCICMLGSRYVVCDVCMCMCVYIYVCMLDMASMRGMRMWIKVCVCVMCVCVCVGER